MNIYVFWGGGGGREEKVFFFINKKCSNLKDITLKHQGAIVQTDCPCNKYTAILTWLTHSTLMYHSPPGFEAPEPYTQLEDTPEQSLPAASLMHLWTYSSSSSLGLKILFEICFLFTYSKRDAFTKLSLQLAFIFVRKKWDGMGLEWN